MSSKCDPVIGISSFNDAETIESCRLWRKKIVTKDAASSFRISGSLTASCSAIRRRAIHLNRRLISTNETKNAKFGKSIAAVEFAAIHELVRLVGNVTFFDVLSRITVKEADVVQHLVLGTLLEYGDLRLDVATSIIRLFGNLCESKESAAAVLQSKPCVNGIVRWLTKNLDEDLERQHGNSVTCSTPDCSKGDMVTRSMEFDKLREQCMRSLRNSAACGKHFARHLIRFDAVYVVGRFLRFCINERPKHQPKSRDAALRFLLLLLPLKDHNFSQQLQRADISSVLIEAAKSSDMDEACAKEIAKLLLGMITHYSTLRIELSKCGAIDWTKELVEKFLIDENWKKDVSKEGSAVTESIIALSRFCRDAYTRSRLRQCQALDLLLRLFINEDLKTTTIFYELMTAFLCFLYDDLGLKYLVEYSGFLLNVVGIVDRFKADYPCKAAHLENGDKSDEMEASPTFEFRADSPSYKKFRLDVSGDGHISFDGPLCKDFSNAVLPSASPLQNVSSPSSSPGPSWSPSASSLQSFSSIGSSSPPTIGSDGCWSLSDNRSVDDLEYNWMEFDCERRYSNCSIEQSPHALCDCDMPSGENLAPYKYREQLVWTAVKLLSWLSHSDHASVLLNEEYLVVLLSYIAGVCRPEPRIGRLIERLARNRLFTESLLRLNFHQIVGNILCVPKCHGGNMRQKPCARCRKICKIGCSITKSFKAQVDTDFGFGTLEHMFVTGDTMAKRKCLCALLCLIKSPFRIRRMMSEDGGGLRILIDALSSLDTDASMLLSILKAFYAALNKDCSREWFLQSSATAIISTECTLSSIDNIEEENRVTFLETNGSGRIDCDVRMLTTSSPFYRAMFSGSYSESNQRIFVHEEENSGSSFAAFAFYVHFLHGCRNCINAELHSAPDCLSILELADKRLCCALGEFVVRERVASFLQHDNALEFVLNAILRRDFVLFKMCIDFIFALCEVDDFAFVVTTFRASDHKLEFFLMLTKYLKGELGIE